MSNGSVTARALWIFNLTLPGRRTIILIAAGVAILAIALALTQLPPSVPDLPPEQARALGVRLAEAARGRDASTVEQLLKQGADPSQSSADGTPAIVWAAHFSDEDTVRRLIRYSADVNAASRLGLTALHVASGRGDGSIVDRLLDAGADHARRDGHGLTPLMMAARQGSVEVADALLDAGADPDAADPTHGVTSLMLAGWHAHPEVTARLLRAGSDVAASTKVGPTPAFRPPNFGGGSHGDGIVRGGVPPEGQRAPIPGGMTALLYAARAGDVASVEMLVDAGADIERAEANNIGPLLMAILNGRLDVATYLIDKRADVNRADWYGRTPLWAAVDVRNLDLAPNATDNTTDRPAALKLIGLLLERGARPNHRVNRYPPVRAHLNEGGSLAWVDFTGQTAFLRAALSGDVDSMKLLMKHGADPNIATYRGTTPLMAAAGVNWVYYHTYDEGEDRLLEALKLCLEQGQDVNAANSMKVTALHGAANRGSNKIIEFLVDKGARLDFADDQGRTALTWARGVFLATLPAEEKPDTMALIGRLCAERGVQCEAPRGSSSVTAPPPAAARRL
jgi:ankyrin repeat protein